MWGRGLFFREGRVPRIRGPIGSALVWWTRGKPGSAEARGASQKARCIHAAPQRCMNQHPTHQPQTCGSAILCNLSPRACLRSCYGFVRVVLP